MLLSVFCVSVALGCSGVAHAALREVASVPAEDPLMRHIPNYHFKMLRDDLRNNAFYEGLRDAIVPNVSHVIDLGAGTCLLSMMAARLGARRVTAIERHPMLASICRELVEVNGFSGVIEMINDYSTSVFVDPRSAHPSAISEPGDVLVSETFDSWIIEEGFFPSLLDLRRRGVISRDATIVPSKAGLFVQLAESTFSFGAAPATVAGFNYEAARKHRPVNTFVENSLDIVYKNLTGPVEALRFDFQNKVDFMDYCQYVHIPFDIITDGVIHGATFWFNMHLDAADRTVLSNKPGTLWSSWNQMFTLFQWGDVHVRAGEKFHLLIGQLHSRYVFANANLGQRLVKVVNQCSYPVDVHASTAETSLADDLSGREYRRFSFQGGIEYNIWVSFGQEQRFKAFVRHGEGAPCEHGLSADGSADGACIRHQPDEYIVRDSVDIGVDAVPLHVYVVSC